MVMNASGQIDIGGSQPGVSVALELSRVGTPINLNDADVRALAARPSGQISYSDFYGKSAGTVDPPPEEGVPIAADFSFMVEGGIDGQFYSGVPGVAKITFHSDGRCTYYTEQYRSLADSSPTPIAVEPNFPNWWSITTAGIGANYLIRFVESSATPPSWYVDSGGDGFEPEGYECDVVNEAYSSVSLASDRSVYVHGIFPGIQVPNGFMVGSVLFYVYLDHVSNPALSTGGWVEVRLANYYMPLIV
jgi:hypothetical protein